MDRHAVQLSKFLSLVLRHRPETLGLTLDAQGWVEIDALLAAAAAHGRPITREALDEVVATNDKQRFAISDDGLWIRASQGHSIPVELGYEPTPPPALLCHGTATRNLGAIRREGLRRGRRQYVHLSADAATAVKVGRRHGAPVVLEVRACEMAAAGYDFFLAANGVWLTDHVPAEFITFEWSMEHGE